MDLIQLRYFKKIAECGTMSQAARKLHVSQPALSAAVRKLEQELSVRLFERTKSRLVLNDMGKLALTYAVVVLEKADEMKNTFRRCVRKNSILALGFCDPGPMRFSVPLFQKAYPGIDVTSEIIENEDDVLNFLLSGKYDAVVSLKQVDHDETECRPFAEEELMLSVPAEHILASKKSVCLLDEDPLEIAVYCGSGAYVRQLRPFLDRLSEKHTVKIYDDYFVFKQMLDQKKAVTFTTRLVRRYRHDGDNRVFIPLADTGITAVYRISYLKRNKKYVAALLDWAAENHLPARETKFAF